MGHELHEVFFLLHFPPQRLLRWYWYLRPKASGETAGFEQCGNLPEISPYGVEALPGVGSWGFLWRGGSSRAAGSRLDCENLDPEQFMPKFGVERQRRIGALAYCGHGHCCSTVPVTP